MDFNIAVPVVKPSTRRRLSRYGCRNCKLRKLKCDETRPCCKRCRTYGVACNFGYNVADLQPLHQAEVSENMLRESPARLMPPRALISNAAWSSNKSSFLNLDRRDQELFCQFRCRTVHSLGGPELVATYENQLFRDSFTCPALMHGILAMAAVHDRYLTAQPIPRRSKQEIYHSSQCATLFSNWLVRPIEEELKDAVWATAVMLANLTFSSINVSSFVQAWPLKSSDSSDLQWLRLKASDKIVWQLADPTRPTSVFRTISDTFSCVHQPLPARGIGSVPFQLASLCGLNESSAAKSNPYFVFVHALSQLLEVPDGKASLGMIFWVVSVISNVFRTHLEEKDPVALLLLYLWYSKARGYRWWIDLRAQYEMPAIRAYLQQHHSDLRSMQTLLPTESWKNLDTSLKHRGPTISNLGWPY